MMAYRYGALALVAAALLSAQNSFLSGAFEPAGGASPEPRFEVVPRQPPVSEDDGRAGKMIRPRVLVQTDDATRQIRDHFLRAVLLSLAGFAGFGVLACRIYGRRQGNPATKVSTVAAGSDDRVTLGSSRSRG
jgi:hypothetical protein